MKRRTALLLTCLFTGPALTSCTARVLIQPSAHSGKLSRNNIDAVAFPPGHFVPSTPRPVGTDTIHLCTATANIATITGDPIRRVSPWQRAAGDLVEWTVTTGTGTLPAYKSYRVSPCAFGAWNPCYLQRFVVGRENQEYTVVVRNRSKERLEIVVHADGPDATKGKAAIAKSRSIVEPRATIRIRGVLFDCCSLAPFKFPGATDAGGVHKPGVVGITVFTPWSVSVDGIPADPRQLPPY